MTCLQSLRGFCKLYPALHACIPLCTPLQAPPPGLLNPAMCHMVSESEMRLQNTEEPGSQVQGTVLEPCKVAVRMDMGGDAGDIQLTLSDLRMNLSPDVLELALSVQSSVLEPLVQPAPDRYTHQF